MLLGACASSVPRQDFRRDRYPVSGYSTYRNTEPAREETSLSDSSSSQSDEISSDASSQNASYQETEATPASAPAETRTYCRRVTKPAPAECSSDDFYLKEVAKCGASYLAKFCKSVVNKNISDLSDEAKFAAKHVSAQSCMAAANTMTGKEITGYDVAKTVAKQLMSDAGGGWKVASDVWTHGEALICTLNVASHCSEKTENVCN